MHLGENGERLYKMHCSGCHKIDGTAATGPALNLIWDTDESLADGSTRRVDDNYVKDSILYPERDIVAGYTNQMQAFAGKLSDEDVNSLIAYLKYLKDPAKFADDDSVMTPADELKKSGEDKTGESDDKSEKPETPEPSKDEQDPAADDDKDDESSEPEVKDDDA